MDRIGFKSCHRQPIIPAEKLDTGGSEKETGKGRALHSILPDGGTLVLGALKFKIDTFAKGRIQFERKGPAARPRKIAGRVCFENGNSVAVSGVMRAGENRPAIVDALRVGHAAAEHEHEFFEIASERRKSASLA